MKLILVALLFVASTAQGGRGGEGARYSCPEEDVNFSGYDIGHVEVDGLLSWEDCGDE